MFACRQLVREAERLARSWGYRELALEVGFNPALITGSSEDALNHDC